MKKNIDTSIRAEILCRKLILTNDETCGGTPSQNIARSLDAALISVGFKLSNEALRYVASLPEDKAFTESGFVLSQMKKLVGDHVKHNVYFKSFPKNVPNTMDFWLGLLAEHLEEGGWWTNNLLEFRTYGRYQHTFDEMMAEQQPLRLKKGHNLKIINLGYPFAMEAQDLYQTLATSPVPLNPDDRMLLSYLYENGHFCDDFQIPVRENKAIINALRVESGLPIQADTVVDILRLAAHMSNGDVTLTEKTKFRSFGRAARRMMVLAINEMVSANPHKIDDASPYREQFKRLAEKLHPRDIKGAQAAHVFFDFCAGSTDFKTFNAKLHEAIENKKLPVAANLLAKKPGYLAKNLDVLFRMAKKNSDRDLIDAALASGVEKISGRNLITAYNHLENRASKKTDYRIFINKQGKGHAEKNKLAAFKPEMVGDALKIMRDEIANRVGAMFQDKKVIVDWESVTGVALPLSEKNKSTGFDVMPRGSEIMVPKNGSLRFFVYWKQKSYRTDYDLSICQYDKNWNFLGQVSWTNLRDGNVVHSGDVTDAMHGASEFIDIDLTTMRKDVKFIIPTINVFTGEKFDEVEECFFGYMERPKDAKGAPFEAKTVKTKFALSGKGQVAMPMAFIRNDDGNDGTAWKMKWLELYMAGQAFANRVEDSKFSQMLLAKAIVEKKFFTVDELLQLGDVWKRRLAPKEETDLPIVYIGLRRPENLPEGATAITLSDFKNLIP